MTKGDETRASILREGLDLTSEIGLEALSLGGLAKRVGMSKSGLYAHFSSKEDLQCQVLDATAELFVDVVLAPALKQSRGLPRLRALFSRWLDWSTKELSGGCPFVAASAEYDDRPGPVRDRLVSHLRDVTETVSRAAAISVEEGHLRKDLDLEQFAFEYWGILLAFHHFCRLMHSTDARAWADRALENLIKNAGGK
jgi:AcrR family transcriptional regulator